MTEVQEQVEAVGELILGQPRDPREFELVAAMVQLCDLVGLESDVRDSLRIIEAELEDEGWDEIVKPTVTFFPIDDERNTDD